MFKKITAFICTVSLILCLCSCVSATELRDRAIVQIMGIDYEKGKYKLTLQEYLPTQKEQEKSQGSSEEFVLSEGDTIYDAMKNAESKDGNQVFYGQCRLYILGNELLEKGIEQISEFMNSN